LAITTSVPCNATTYDNIETIIYPRVIFQGLCTVEGISISMYPIDGAILKDSNVLIELIDVPTPPSDDKLDINSMVI